MDNKKNKRLFAELEKISKQENFLYLNKFAEERGFTEEIIEAMAKENEDFKHILAIAKMCISFHAEEMYCKELINENEYIQLVEKYDYFLLNDF